MPGVELFKKRFFLVSTFPSIFPHLTSPYLFTSGGWYEIILKPKQNHTMFVAGVQAMVILLSVALVICTGAVIGGITISAGYDLLDKARATGDDGVASCLLSGEEDLHNVANRYLKATSLGVTEKVGQYLDVPERALRELAQMVEAQHPDTANSADFIDTLVRSAIRSRIEVTAELGTDQIAYYPLPFSPSHQTPGSSGGELAYLYRVDLGENPVLQVVETRANGSFGFNAAEVEVGMAMPNGQMYRQPGKPCDRDYDLESVCVVYPKTSVGTDIFNEVAGRATGNIFSEGPLNPVGEVSYAPVTGFHNFLQLMATYTLSHPSMHDATPRQNKRTGMFFVGVQGDGLARIFQHLELPKESHIYCIDRNPWSQAVGTLLAYNAGRYMTVKQVELQGQTSMYAETIDILNHTQVNESKASVIAEHGAEVLGGEGYAVAARETADHFGVFQASEANGAVLYWTMVQVVERANLRFYISLLVPREAVMGTIDDSRARIFDKNLADRNDQDSQKRSSLIMTACVIAVVVASLFGLAVFMAKWITRPLYTLQQDMHQVSLMNLDQIDLDRSLSHLHEVNAMQHSFCLMVKNLIEFRNYMPQSVLIQGTDEENGGPLSPGINLGSGQFSSRALSGADRRRSYRESPAPGSIQKFPGVPTVLEESMRSSEGTETPVLSPLQMSMRRIGFGDSFVLKKKSVTMVAFNIKGWHAHLLGRGQGDAIAGHSDWAMIIMQTVQAGKGVIDTFSGDRILAAYNAYSMVTTHRVSAVQAAYSARCRVAVGSGFGEVGMVESTNQPELSFAICSGDARVGHMGCQGMKKVTIVSEVVPWVVALEQFNKVHGYKGLIDTFVARDVKTWYDLQTVDGISFPKRTANAIRVFVVHQQKGGVKEDEWMYQLQQMDSASNYVQWNVTFENIVSGEWEKAEESFVGIPAALATEAVRLRAYIDDQEFNPAIIKYH